MTHTTEADAQALYQVLRRCNLSVDDWLNSDCEQWNDIWREAGLTVSPNLTTQLEVMRLAKIAIPGMPRLVGA